MMCFVLAGNVPRIFWAHPNSADAKHLSSIVGLGTQLVCILLSLHRLLLNLELFIPKAYWTRHESGKVGTKHPRIHHMM